MQVSGAGFCISSKPQLVLEKGCSSKPGCAGCGLGSLGFLPSAGAFKLAVELAPSSASFLSTQG